VDDQTNRWAGGQILFELGVRNGSRARWGLSLYRLARYVATVNALECARFYRRFEDNSPVQTKANVWVSQV